MMIGSEGKGFEDEDHRSLKNKDKDRERTRRWSEATEN
jgi:hypothetical protein